MPTFDVDKEQINIFELNDLYLFSHYFENKVLYNQLKGWCVEHQYRFEVPTDEIDQIKILSQGFFDPVIIEDPTPYYVAIHNELEYKNILINSVLNWAGGNQRYFLMKDQLSVETAIEKGAQKPDSETFPMRRP